MLSLGGRIWQGTKRTRENLRPWIDHHFPATSIKFVIPGVRIDCRWLEFMSGTCGGLFVSLLGLREEY